MSIPVLDFTVEATAAIPRGRVLVRSGPNKGAPASANPNLPHAILGVSLHGQPVTGRSVAVRRIGIAEVETSAAVAAGDLLTVSGSDGRVRPAARPALTINGNSGTSLTVRLHAYDRAFAGFRAVVVNPGTNNAALAVVATPAGLEISLATNGSAAAITTIGDLRAALQACVLGYRFTYAQVGTDSGIITPGTYAMSPFASEEGVIGIAQSEGAVNALVPVLLTL